MPWFKVDDGMHSHPKTIIAGTAAIGLWARCGSWSSDELQDGFVPTEVALHFGTRAMCKALVRSGLWTEVDGGYQFHDWGDRNPLKEHVELVRESKREAGRAGGIAAAKARANGKHPASETAAESKHSAKQNGQQVLKQNRSPGPGPVVGGSLRDGPEVSNAGEDSDHHESQTETEALEHLALDVRRLRPDWQLAKIRKAVVDARSQSGSLSRTTAAMFVVAIAGDSTSPRRVLSDGFWWEESDDRHIAALLDPRLTEVLEAVS